MKKIEKAVVLVIEEVYRKGRAVFDTVTDMEIVIAPADEDSLSQMVKERNAFAVVLGVEKYTGPLYETIKKGGIIARFGVACDGLDFKKAESNNLHITNTPGTLDFTVAEFTVFLASEVLRKIGNANRKVKNGIWYPYLGTELNGKTWAIIGLGNIGKQLSKILSFGFGVRVLGLDLPEVIASINKEEYGIVQVHSDLRRVISEADIVSLHIPANRDNYHLINRERLELFNPGSFLINTGRGSLIDENDLYVVLENGHLAGAGLDVFENEPYFPVDSKKDLRKLSNVVLTPHIASSTIECSKRMAERALQNIRYGLEQKYEQMDIVSA